MVKQQKYNAYSDLGLGKVPPQAIEIEEAVLGACMLQSESIEEIINIVVPETFYRDENQRIYSSILKLYNQNKKIDLYTIMEQLKVDKELETIGGPLYLSELTNKVASGAHIEYHARIIQQKYIKRELIRISTEIQNRSFDDSNDIDDLIDFAHEQINRATTTNIKKMGETIGQVGKKRLKKIEEIKKNGIGKTGVRSFVKWDRKTSGWQPSNLIILAARPGQGKSRIALELAKKADLDFKNGEHAVMFLLEMTDEETYDRELSSQTGIENMDIRKGQFTDEDWKRIENAHAVIENEKILLDDCPGLTINEFRAKARYYKKKFNCGLIIIDYLQLMKYPEFKFNREREISEISGSLKKIAKELKIPIIALSQLSRECEKRTDKRPILSDLRESGSIEQDADVVLFLFRPEYYNIDVDEMGNSTKNLIEVIFAKNRSGSLSSSYLYKSDNWSIIYEYRSDENYSGVTEIENTDDPF